MTVLTWKREERRIKEGRPTDKERRAITSVVSVAFNSSMAAFRSSAAMF
jgi:hypothetical protein